MDGRFRDYAKTSSWVASGRPYSENLLHYERENSSPLSSSDSELELLVELILIKMFEQKVWVDC